MTFRTGSVPHTGPDPALDSTLFFGERSSLIEFKKTF